MADIGQKILEAIQNQSSFKIIDKASHSTGMLEAEQLAPFIRYAREATVVLKSSRMLKMVSDTKNINILDFPSGFLRPGRTKAGVKNVLSKDVSGDEGSVTTAQNQLIAKEYIGQWTVDYEFVEDNIEQTGIVNTIMQEAGAAAGVDLERAFVYGDSDLTYDTSWAKKILSVNDGWLKLCNNKLYGVGASKDFDPAAKQAPLVMFDAMIKAMDKRFLQRDQLVFNVGFDVEDAVRDLYGARSTALGDLAITGAGDLYYKKIKIEYTPAFDDPTYTALVGTPAMLSKPSQRVWGIKREVNVKTRDEIADREYLNVMTMRADAQWENRNSGVVAFIDKENPSP